MRTIVAAALTALVWLTPLTALAQAPTPPPGQAVEADAVRCWWRTELRPSHDWASSDRDGHLSWAHPGWTPEPAEHRISHWIERTA